MSRPAHFLDPYQFQIEEMVRLGCTDEHICRVLEDITGQEVEKRTIINKRTWVKEMKNKRKQYEPYKEEVMEKLATGYTIKEVYTDITSKSGIQTSIITFQKYVKQNELMPTKKDVKSPVALFGTMEKYMEFRENWVRTSCKLNRTMSNPNRVLMRRYLQ